MRLSALAATTALLLLPTSAAAETFGTDLDRPVNSTRTCETGFFDPDLIGGTGFPYTPYDSCTWWSVGSIKGTGNSIVPYGGGTVKRIRVKVGTVTGRMQVVALRLVRHPGSLADPGCCFPSSASPVFTPEANAITEIDVDMPVKHETDPRTGIVNYDALALSVLDDGVPVPISETADGGWGGIVAGMFPAYTPGEERSVGYGTVTTGHVLLEADLEPAPKPEAKTPPLAPETKPLPPQTKPGQRAETAPPPPAVATIGAQRGRLRRGHVALPVTCAAAEGCRGKLVVRTTGKKPRTLARASVYVPKGKTRTVSARLTSAARKALKRSRSVAATATITMRGRPSVTQAITLKR